MPMPMPMPTRLSVFAVLLSLTALLPAAGCGEAGLCPVMTVSTTASGPTEMKWKSAAEVEYAKVHTGRFVTPAGRYIDRVGTMPTGAALSPDGRFLAVACSGGRDFTLPVDQQRRQSVRIIETASGTIAHSLIEDETFLGIAFSPDGSRLFVSGGLTDRIYVYDAAGGFARLADIEVPGYPFGLTVTPDGGTLLVASSHRQEVVAIDTASLAAIRRYPSLTYPWQVAVDPSGLRACVSNVGANAVTILDLAAGETAGHVSVGNNPEGVAMHAGLCYVLNNDDDTLSVVDTAELTVLHTRSLREGEQDPPGRLPVDLRLDPDGGRIYVTLAADNSLLVLDFASLAPLGEIPTGFYPVDVELAGDTLFVASAKGLGSGPFFDETDPEQNPGAEVGQFYGGVTIVPVPDAAALAAHTDRVHANNRASMQYFSADCDTWASPVPNRPGVRSEQIRHVVWIVKENKTYDVLLGDLTGTADHWHRPDLAVYGESATIAIRPDGFPAGTRFNITPNQHAIARRWVDVVNFYDNSQKSTEGHMWLTAGWLNDFGEKFSLLWQVRGERNFMLPNIDPVSRPGTGDIFSWMLDHGRTVRVYGEFVGSAAEIFGRGYEFVCQQYVPGITKLDDTEKIKVFQREFEQGIFRDFTYIWVPNDHAMGMDPGAPHPAYMIADNDEAVGRIIDTISRSDHWKETVVFVFQDDPQDSPDHIDTHRSILLAASPWVRRGHLSELHYDMTAVLKTTLQILGLPPISRYEALAPAMHDLFTLEPDFAPYEFVPRDRKFSDRETWINPDGTELARRSRAMEFGLVDSAAGYGKLMWEVFRGDEPFPAHLVSQSIDDGEEGENRFRYTDPAALERYRLPREVGR